MPIFLALEIGFGLRYLHELGFGNKFGRWLPHKLTAANKKQRTDICSQLLSQWPLETVLDNLVTGDEKWVLHVNIRRRKQWIHRDAQAQPTPKGDLFPKKVMLSVWWDKRGIIYWELLPKGKTIDGKTYSRQLEGVRCAVRRLRPEIKKVRLLHDNARPHVCNPVQETVKKFRWTVIQHPPYSPDLAPTDFHLFRSLQNFLDGQEYADEAAVQSAINGFFDSLPESFFKSGIYKLVKRWEFVAKSGGEYCPNSFDE